MLPRETSGGPYSRNRSEHPPNRMTARDQVSAVGEGCSGCVGATRERGRLVFADFDFATASFPLSGVRDFDAERDLRLRVDVAATSSLVACADFDAARDRLRVGFDSEP
jgi:hypothetical protein